MHRCRTLRQAWPPQNASFRLTLAVLMHPDWCTMDVSDRLWMRAMAWLLGRWHMDAAMPHASMGLASQDEMPMPDARECSICAQISCTSVSEHMKPKMICHCKAIEFNHCQQSGHLHCCKRHAGRRCDHLPEALGDLCCSAISLCMKRPQVRNTGRGGMKGEVVCQANCSFHNQSDAVEIHGAELRCIAMAAGTQQQQHLWCVRIELAPRL